MPCPNCGGNWPLDNEPKSGVQCRKEPACKEAAVQVVQAAVARVDEALAAFKTAAAEEIAANPDSELTRILKGGMPSNTLLGGKL